MMQPLKDQIMWNMSRMRMMVESEDWVGLVMLMRNTILTIQRNSDVKSKMS